MPEHLRKEVNGSELETIGKMEVHDAYEFVGYVGFDDFVNTTNRIMGALRLNGNGRAFEHIINDKSQNYVVRRVK